MKIRGKIIFTGVLILIFGILAVYFVPSELFQGRLTATFSKISPQKAIQNKIQKELPYLANGTCNGTCLSKIIEENSQYIEVLPGTLPSLNNFTEGYYPLFRLIFHNISDVDRMLYRFKVNLGNNWEIPLDYLYLLNDAGGMIGRFTGIDDSGNVSMIGDEVNGLFTLSSNEYRAVTFAWKENVFSKEFFRKTIFSFEIPRQGMEVYRPLVYDPAESAMRIAVDAYLPSSVVLGRRQGFLNNEITREQELEQITFVVNSGLAALYPNWQTNAQQLIDGYNRILSVNTRKQFRIGEFKVLPTLDHLCPGELPNHPEYFLSNGSYGGMTIFYTIDDPGTPPPTNCEFSFAVAGEQTINGQSFGTVFMNSGYDPNLEYPSLGSLTVLIHEAGHAAFSLADWYLYFYESAPVEDNTGITPILNPYVPEFLNGNINDPMINAGEMPYSDFNAFIINHNANHRFNTGVMRSFFLSKRVKLKVVDQRELPVANAEVKIFGMRKNALEVGLIGEQPLLQTLRTNNQGEVDLPMPSSAIVNRFDDPSLDYTVKAVKVSKNNLAAGSYYSTLDLQHDVLMNGKDIYEIKLVLK